MEIELYIDNFRGFSNTFIPIKKVNYFVGENSTGKTSLLSLLYLLGSPEFQENHKFNSSNVKLGTFNDIFGGSRENHKKEFRIGYIEEKKGNQADAILYTFREKENNPELKRINAITESGELDVIFDGEIIKKRKIVFIEDKRKLTEIRSLFNQWIEIDYDLSEYILIKSELPLQGMPFWFVFSTLFDDASEKPLDFFRRDIILPSFVKDMIWIAPIRSKPHRTYDEFRLDFNPEGDHIPYLIKNLLFEPKKNIGFKRYLEDFGKNSGLFESIATRDYADDLFAPFELQVQLGNLKLPIMNVGYGVSQALPIIVELYNQSNGSTFAIQQPEVHLHPKAQASIGDVVFNLAAWSKKNFFIETHSDYLIDRFRKNVRDAKQELSISAQVLFFSRGQFGNTVQSIPIMNDGSYSIDQPSEFREFFINESLDLLGI